MNESTKTLTFLGVAIAAVALAFFTRPSSADFDVQSEKGKPFAEFDHEQAKRMKIVQFNEETATLREFEVAEEDGVWKIPSKGGYPADAQQQMGKAVTGVMDREIVDVATNSAADHDQYGVVDPSSSKLAVGQTGVGTRVTLSSGANDSLVDLIIGKPVKDATNNQHYVRKPTQDPVYVLEINPEDFSTKFEDWIEPDLLKLNSFDVKEVVLNDYSFSADLVMTNRGLEPQLDWDRRNKMTLVYDEPMGEWQAKELQSYDEASDSYKPFTLAENQELNSDSLRELKNALDDLRIVDVDRKPEGLSADLKAGEDFMRDEQALRSLVPRGIMPVGIKPGEVELLSSEGEAIITLKDGVEYVLRFGNLKLASDVQNPDAAADPAAAAVDPAADPAADAEKKPDAEEGINRYLFVMAQFNENAVAKPTLEELPALPETVSEGEAEESETASEGEAEKRDDATAVEPPAEQPEGENASEQPAEQPEADAAETPVDAEPETDAPAEGEKPADADTPEEGAAAETADEDSAKKLEENIAQRKAIEQENQRKLDEYQQTLEKGRERVKELNERFGDWYYVISNDVFEKIHLGRDQVIQEKKPEGEAEAAPGTPAVPSSPFGAPGTAIPSLPAVPAAPAEKPATEQPAPETTEPAAEPPAPPTEPAEATPPAEPPATEPAPPTETPNP
ncbi:MAG: DUF4340 domain-containing protein [Pirellulales bacterium]